MRILFSSSPFAGHLFPLLPLARAAHAGEHDIAVLTSEPLAPALDPSIEVLPAGPMPDMLLAEVARRTGTDPTRDNAPEIVAELFAGPRVDLGFEQALAAAERWRPELAGFEKDHPRSGRWWPPRWDARPRSWPTGAPMRPRTPPR